MGRRLAAIALLALAFGCSSPGPRADTPRDPGTPTRGRLAEIAPSLCDRVLVVHADVPDPHSVNADGRKGNLTGSVRNGGLGTLIDNAGLVLTAAHVVRDAAVVQVISADGRAHPAASVALHSPLDLALLSVPSLSGTPLSPQAARADAGSAVAALAARLPNSAPDVRFGVLLRAEVSMQRQLRTQSACDYGGLLESSVALEPGFSGSPLVDTEGRFIAVNLAAAGQDAFDRRAYSQPFDARTLAAVAELRRQVTEAPQRRVRRAESAVPKLD